MNINLSSIIKNEGGTIEFSDEIQIGSMQVAGSDMHFAQPVKVSGGVINVGSVLELTAAASGKVTTCCGRCNKEITRDFVIDISEVLVQDNGNAQIANEDVVVFTGYSLPFDEIVENNIYTGIETRYLCKEDCRGLCPVCGKDLNVGNCGCADNNIDPRFAVLSKFKNN